MRISAGWSAVLAGILSVGILFTGAPASAETHDIATQTRIFLDAYARGDRSTVLGLVNGDEITVFGSDVAEICHGSAEVSRLLSNDLRLWGGPAHIGPMEHVSIAQSGGLASIFFDAPFSAGGRAPLPVRFSMVWRRTGKGWRLVQSSNVVPTQGQSAAQLLATAAKSDSR
jgi:ketosteroid isomerase-like protein